MVSTDDREIALGILRALRRHQPVVCFATGHGEYDIDNFEFHTHFEGAQGHSHNSEGSGVVQMEQHGLGRLRRAVEKLGLATRKVELAAGRPVPAECDALIDANPRTPHAPLEADILRRYLQAGGSYMLLVEPDFAVEPRLAGLLADAGVRIGEGVVVDPVDHYFTDEQMIAVTRYANHPVTRSQALSFYPGARPVEPVPGADVKATVLFASSPQSYVVRDRMRLREEAATAQRRAQPLAVAAEGRLAGGSARPFRLIVVGDADFASNSFFPYLANADIVLAGVSWLLREERLPTLKPPVEVLPQVTLTNAQVRWIFILTVILLPGAVALDGRRRMAVAPPLIRRAAWPLAAAVAFGFLAALALHGERPDAGLAPFKAAGLFTAFAPEDAREVEHFQGGRDLALPARGRNLAGRRSAPAGSRQRCRPHRHGAAPVAGFRSAARPLGRRGGARGAVRLCSGTAGAQRHRARPRRGNLHRPLRCRKSAGLGPLFPGRGNRRGADAADLRGRDLGASDRIGGRAMRKLVASLLLTISWTGGAAAHVTSTGLATLDVADGTLAYRLTVVATEVDDQAGRLFAAAAEGDRAAAERVAGFLRDHARFSIADEPCRPGRISIRGSGTGDDKVVLDMALSCPRSTGTLSIRDDWPEVMGAHFQTVLSVRQPGRPSVEFVFLEDRRAATLDLATGTGTGWFAFIAMGIEHILGGHRSPAVPARPAGAGARPLADGDDRHRLHRGA